MAGTLSPTRRQREVLALAAEGLDNQQIAEQLFVSKRTVEDCFYQMYKRLKVENRTQAAVLAVRKGWI